MRSILALIGSLAILAGIAGAAFFFGGYYNISATGEDPPPIATLLITVRNASIAHHATDVPQAGFTDAATAQAGARAYAARGCANCHGAPGVGWAKFSEGLNPGPPDLKEVAANITPAQLFWVIKNGIRMTGMPSFGAAGVPDAELWQITAFVKKLPVVTDADYKAWTEPKP